MFDRDERNVSGCGLSGLMSASRRRVDGTVIIDSMCNMRDRGNGLGSGYAAYGIYPDFKDYWCFHMMYQDEGAKVDAEEYLNRYFKIKHHEPIPTKKVRALGAVPLLFRYFLTLRDEMRQVNGGEEDCIASCTMEINKHIM